MYEALARVAPAPYVLEMLVRSAYDRSDMRTARERALHLPPGEGRSEWLARIDAASGDERAALAAYLSAGNAPQVQQRIDALARTNVRAALTLERRLIARMRSDADHPDAVADAQWHLGVLLAQSGDRRGALRAFKAASVLGPLNAKYLLSLSALERELGMMAAARADRARAIDADPRLTP